MNKRTLKCIPMAHCSNLDHLNSGGHIRSVAVNTRFQLENGGQQWRLHTNGSLRSGGSFRTTVPEV